MSTVINLKEDYINRIVPALVEEFSYTPVMEVPRLTKISINQGLGIAIADKKILDVAVEELSAITGQKAVITYSKGYIKLQVKKKMPMGTRYIA